jgi:hypothetical protein
MTTAVVAPAFTAFTVVARSVVNRSSKTSSSRALRKQNFSLSRASFLPPSEAAMTPVPKEDPDIAEVFYTT